MKRFDKNARLINGAEKAQPFFFRVLQIMIMCRGRGGGGGCWGLKLLTLDTTTKYSYTYVCNGPVFLKAGVHLNGIFAPLNTGLVQISRSHFKQSKNSMLKT